VDTGVDEVELDVSVALDEFAEALCVAAVVRADAVFVLVCPSAGS